MFESGFSICCCAVVYISVLITSMVLFSQAYATVETGKFAILQNKFSKKFDPEIYYSGRYYTGIAKRFMKYPLQYQTIIFSNRRKGADNVPISSTTSSGSSISISCLVQYAIRPEKIHDLYLKWPNIERLKSDMKLSVKQIVSSTINQYTPSDFRLNRAEINKRMSYNIGNAFKNQFFCDLNVFTISEVILEEKDLSGFLNSKLTEKATLKQVQTNKVTQVESQIASVKSISATAVSTTKSDSQTLSTTAYLTKVASADTAYNTATMSSFKALKGQYNADVDTPTEAGFISWYYLIKLISERKSGSLIFGLD